MFRSQFIIPAWLLSLLCGCGIGSAPAESVSETRKTSVTHQEPAVVASAEETQLEAVPPQTEPAEPGDSPATRAFDSLVKAAESGDADGWAKADAELHQLGRAAVPALTARLTDTNPVSRELAAMFLAQLGPDAEPAAKGLVKLLSDESAFARVNAAAALSTFDGYTEQVVPVLTALLTNFDVNVRLTAATSLRNTGSAADKAVAALTQALSDTDSRVRTAAATTLGELGPSAAKSLSKLKQLEGDEDAQVVAAASRAVRRIDGNSADNPPVTIPASATE